MKGKGKGIRARDRARGRREEGMSFHYFPRAPKFPFNACHRGLGKSVLHVQSFFLLIRPT